MFVEPAVLIVVIVALALLAGLGLVVIWLKSSAYAVVKTGSGEGFRFVCRTLEVNFNYAIAGNEGLILCNKKKQVVGTVPAAGRAMEDMARDVITAGASVL